jgi:hypothetical protein
MRSTVKEGRLTARFIDIITRLVIHFVMKNKEFWVFLFFLGTLLLNWPFLDIFSLVLPYYFFGVWSLFILVVGIVATLKNTKDRDADV